MNRQYIVNTLELVKLALSNSPQIPIFQCFTFTGGSVSAYNDNIAIVGPAEFEGEAGIHGLTLLGLLSNSAAEEVSFELDGNTAHLLIGKTVSKLPFMPLDNFIFTVPKVKWATKMPFTASVAKAIELCLETVTADETQPALHGVTVEKDKFYSCDSDALTRIAVDNPIKGRYLMSTKFCAAVLKLWSSLQMTKGELHFSDEWIMADFGDWSVYGRVLEIKTPIDFEALINAHVQTQPALSQPPAGLSDALSRARVLSDPESAKTVATISKGSLSLRTETHMGEVKDVLQYKTHPDVVANINAAHIQRALRHGESIEIRDNCVVMENSEGVFQLISNMH